MLAGGVIGTANSPAISGMSGPLQGKGAVVHVLPDPKLMGEGTPFDVLTTVLTVLSVACLAFTCEPACGSPGTALCWVGPLPGSPLALLCSLQPSLL